MVWRTRKDQLGAVPELDDDCDANYRVDFGSGIIMCFDADELPDEDVELTTDEPTTVVVVTSRRRSAVGRWEWALWSTSLYEDVCESKTVVVQRRNGWHGPLLSACLTWAAPRLACGDLVVCWSVDWTGAKHSLDTACHCPGFFCI